MVDHGKLVRDIYVSEGTDIVSLQAKIRNFISTAGLRPYDMGVRNVDERGRSIYNQCFYLCIARGYLGHSASQGQTRSLALKLKRCIESAVISERPHWTREVGEEAQAFADFLPIAMRSGNQFLAELAVCVIDSCSAHVEAYIGPAYKDLQDKQMQQRNLVLLWYVPGHYQCIVNSDLRRSKVSMTYKDFRAHLAAHNVPIIETLE